MGLVKKQPTARATASQAGRAMPDAEQNATPLRRQVLQAARRRCDDMQDGTEAREEMKRAVMATPTELLPDLLAALSTVRINRADLFLPIPTQPERSNP
ncbi:MAG: hypothetical protein EOO32_00780 [Comamonadaceae bacterium]|nr:MAG: hypothetical protein EOO32_00780 [Comamonadaceae bacterium]